ncbi:MAG: urea transporter [Ignavibacteriae bacterium]|nr:urea transporter [Ignavibacteriota bacterium]
MRFIKSILKSYSIVFFSDKLFFAGLLMIISFFDYFAGFCGLISVITSFVVAESLGFDKIKIEKGYYGFNSLLAGLGIGLQYEASWAILLIVVLASIFAFFVTISLEGVLGKYLLPYLSLPFLIAYWVVTLEGRDLYFMGLSGRGVYFLNDMYLLGGNRLISIYEWWSKINFIFSLKIYFLSLGAILFQYNVIAGILIAGGILYFSRIAFSLSLIGFYSAFFFYQFLEINITEASYAYIGFNYILSAIAIGGFFLIPSWRSYIWVLVLMPVTVLISYGFSSVFALFHLHIYSLPFNIIVILFLFAVKSRVHKKEGLSEVYFQQNSPENNLYSYLNNNFRFRDFKYYPLRLPFFGEWSVSQAHNGEITHKFRYKHAWDFVIRDSERNTYRNYGLKLEDYYCYNKAILSPADGYVEEIIDGIPDNNIGDVNLENNWGNTIIIRHGYGFYSKICHIKPASFKISQGEWIKTGQIIASCGNSGRSPEPHIHFQLQAVPFIKGETIDYPFSQYILKTPSGVIYKANNKPERGDVISNVEINPVLKEGFNFIPGKVVKFETESKGKKKIVEWEVFTNINNSSYIYCSDSKSTAYFNNDGRVFYFYDFAGSKKSLLYYFFLAAYKVPLGYYQDMNVGDTPALNLVYSKAGLFVQDFVSPFFVFLKSVFKVTYTDIDDMLHTNRITLSSGIENHFLNRRTGRMDFTIALSRNGIDKIEITLKNKIITANCILEQ